MKKIIIGVLIALVVLGAGYFILFRPTKVTRESMTELYNGRKAAMQAAAAYLSDNRIPATIEGLMTPDNNYGVTSVDEDKYREFNENVEKIMSQDFKCIRSDGRVVKFEVPASGGVFTKKTGYIIYDKDGNSVGSAPVRLEAYDWYLVIE